MRPYVVHIVLALCRYVAGRHYVEMEITEQAAQGVVASTIQSLFLLLLKHTRRCASGWVAEAKGVAAFTCCN